MDLKKAKLERRLRSAVSGGDGRRLLDLMDSDSIAVGRLLQEMGSEAGTALADAVRVARTDEELHTAIGWAGSSGDSTALGAVRSVLRDGSPTARREALSTLLVHGTPDDARDIAGLLGHPDPLVRDGVYEALSAFERVGGPDSLPASISTALGDDRARRAQAESEALRKEMEGPLTKVSAAKILVHLCNEIDATYADSEGPQASARRDSLRQDIAQVGRTAFEQGGHDLMRDIARLVASASSHGEYVSREWTGIGGWMG